MKGSRTVDRSNMASQLRRFIRPGYIEEKADQIFRIRGERELLTFRFRRSEVFAPLNASPCSVKGPLVRKGRARGRCRSCGGPSSKYGVRCQACVTGMAFLGAAISKEIEDTVLILDYWLDVLDGKVPDFVPDLIDSIAEREYQLGLPAARWPLTETVGGYQ